MEPADIDWKKVDSRFMRDEAYEHIDAPKWLDLAALDGDPAVDDVAFFCLPDCRHPTTAEDFQRPGVAPSPKAKLLRSSSERLPFGERSNTLRDANNLKKRAGIPAFVPSSSLLKLKAAAAPKAPREDLENQDPNQMTPPPPAARPFATYKADKAAKEMIKSSAEKKVVPEEEGRQQNKAEPRLKSTMSARNLFSAKDILSQISEFCHELKRLAAGIRKPPSAREQEEAVEKSTGIAPAIKVKAVEEEMELVTPKKERGKCKKTVKMAVRIEVEKKAIDENSALLKEVRAFPPTPQRFPSPCSHGRGRNLKSTSVIAGSSLRKPPKSSTVKGSILQEVQNVEEKILLAAKNEGCNKASFVTDIEEGGGGSPADLFWFLKPCTYLVK